MTLAHIGSPAHYGAYATGDLATDMRRLRLHLGDDHGLLYSTFPEGTIGPTGGLDLEVALPILDTFHRAAHARTPLVLPIETTVDDPPADWFEAEGYESTDDGETTDTAAIWPTGTLPGVAKGGLIEIGAGGLITPAPGYPLKPPPRHVLHYEETLLYEMKPDLATVQKDVQQELDEFFGSTGEPDSVHIEMSWDAEAAVYEVVISANLKW